MFYGELNKQNIFKNTNNFIALFIALTKACQTLKHFLFNFFF